MANQRMKLTGAAILVSRDTTPLQAAPAAYPYRSATEPSGFARVASFGSCVRRSFVFPIAFLIVREKRKMPKTARDPSDQRRSLGALFLEWSFFVQLMTNYGKDSDGNKLPPEEKKELKDGWAQTDQLGKELCILAEHYGIDSTPISRFLWDRKFKHLPAAEELARRLDAKEWAEELNAPSPRSNTRALDLVLHAPSADLGLTRGFHKKRHDPLVEKLEGLLETKLNPTPTVSILQSLGDRGCDLLIEWSQQAKYGVQLKSNGDVEEPDFANKTLAQIQDSRQHGLIKLYVVLAADMTGDSNLQKVRCFVSRLSAAHDPYVSVVPPERAWTLLCAKPSRRRTRPNE
jgi:hypothetical protein